jgi:putative membrane protein
MREAASVSGSSETEETATHFSWMRTRMSVERTLMSWVRTATALIGFGFTIFQFFEGLNRLEGVTPARHPATPRVISLALIGIGSLALIVAIREYRAVVRYLWSDEFRDVAGMGAPRERTPAFMVAVLMAVVGVITLTTLLVRTAGSP